MLALLGVLRESRARLTALVLITTLTGYFVARTSGSDWLSAPARFGGTALVAAGAAALNEWWEWDLDRLMECTAGRLLPSARFDRGSRAGGGFGGFAGRDRLPGLGGERTDQAGALVLVSYVLVYTPLKRRTTWNTYVGAVPVALPPLMGWVAARGEIGLGGLALFGVLFLWQIPAFHGDCLGLFG